MLHNAAVYMWNYSIHLVESGEAEPLIPYYRSLLRLIKHLGSERYAVFSTFVNSVCVCVCVCAHVCVCVCARVCVWWYMCI